MTIRLMITAHVYPAQYAAPVITGEVILYAFVIQIKSVVNMMIIRQIPNGAHAIQQKIETNAVQQELSGQNIPSTVAHLVI